MVQLGAARGPGQARHTDAGPTVIGEIDGTQSERARTVARLLEAAGLPVEVSGNVQGHFWSKFVHNCAINPVSAITGLRPFEIARTAAAFALIDRILNEVLAVVAAAGIQLSEDGPRALIHAHCRERSNRPSMLQHLECGRRTEIDALNGALIQRGHALGIPTPFNEAIVMIVKSLEAVAARRTTSADSHVGDIVDWSHPRASPRWITTSIPSRLRSSPFRNRVRRPAGVCSARSRRSVRHRA